MKKRVALMLAAVLVLSLASCGDSGDAPAAKGLALTIQRYTPGTTLVQPEALATVSSFTDVKPGDYFAEPVAWAVEKGITAGTSATTFSPNVTCTQGQILTFLWRANGEPKPAGTVSGTQYYATASQWANEQNLTDNFSAETYCTRSMVVTYLWKLAGSPKSDTLDFSDVPANADYAQAVAWAVESGVTAGTGVATFSPDAICTRGQIVTFLYRAFAQSGSNEFRALEVKEYGYAVNNGYLYYAVILHNPNADYSVQFPEFRVTAKDSEGLLLGTETQTLSIIYSGQDFCYAGLAFEVEDKPATVDVEIVPPDDYNIQKPQSLTHPNYEPMMAENVVVRTDSIMGEIKNNNDYAIDMAVVTVIFRDENGNIVAGDSTFVDKIAANGSIPFDIQISEEIITDNFEVYANIW